MIRRSFRIGLVLGALAGLVLALAKLLQGRREPALSAPPRPWPPLDQPAPPPAPRVAPESVVPPEPEPLPEPVPEPPPAPQPPPLPEPPPRPEPEPLSEPEPMAAAAAAPAKQAAKRAVTAAKSAKKATKRSTRKSARKRSAANAAAVAPWVEPDSGVCPTSHPVKAKLSSMIFHLPGMFAYDRTRPDRCYRDALAAEGDGLRPAKR